MNDKIYLIDFGLSQINNINNSNNLEIFIELLNIFNEKFKIITDIEQRHLYYCNFLNNIKLNKINKYKNNIY